MVLERVSKHEAGQVVRVLGWAFVTKPGRFLGHWFLRARDLSTRQLFYAVLQVAFTRRFDPILESVDASDRSRIISSHVRCSSMPYRGIC